MSSFIKEGYPLVSLSKSYEEALYFVSCQLALFTKSDFVGLIDNQVVHDPMFMKDCAIGYIHPFTFNQVILVCVNVNWFFTRFHFSTSLPFERTCHTGLPE